MSDPQPPPEPPDSGDDTPQVDIHQTGDGPQVGYVARDVNIYNDGGSRNPPAPAAPPSGNSSFMFAVLALVALVIAVIALVIIAQNGANTGPAAQSSPPTTAAAVIDTATPTPTETPTATLTETVPATQTSTPTATLTLTPTPTESPLPVVIATMLAPSATLTLTSTPTDIPSATPTTAAPGPSLNISRTRDTLALCLVGGPADLSALWLAFDSNEYYLLGDGDGDDVRFPESVNAQPGDCWCLRQEPYLLAPSQCTDANTVELRDVGISWINALVTVQLGGDSIQCPAQAQRRDVYACPVLVLHPE